MGKCSKFLCGIIVIVAGGSVLLTLYLPTPWLIAVLGGVLIWAGLKLICR